MGSESRKSKQYFSEFEKSLFSGSVIDIGAGNDPIVEHAEIFDLQHGDANHISRYVSSQFDCVYSSHCLEHMYNPYESLQEWFSLVKPGGYLFVLVPDEDLYEQGFFPSVFNSDHKHSFTIAKKRSWCKRSINVIELCCSLKDAEIISIQLVDIGYDRKLSAAHNARAIDQTQMGAVAQIEFIIRKTNKSIEANNAAAIAFSPQSITEIARVNTALVGCKLELDQVKKELFTTRQQLKQMETHVSTIVKDLLT
ncbi:MAG: methyltransferase domain-containing protein [Bacillota bacterium]